MNILDWFNPTRWLILGGIVLALGAGVLGYGEWRASNATEAADQRWEAAVSKLKADAATQLGAETRKTLEAERKLTAALAAQENTDADNAQTVAALREDLRRKSRAAGGPGLRDPFAAGCGGGGGDAGGPVTANAVDRGEDPALPGRLLSPELEGLLIDRLTRADQINVAYASCRADSQAVRAKPAPP